MALTKVQTIGIETGVSLTGVTTVTTLNASTDTLSVGGTVNFGGNVSIAGTLTYEDVTNIDSVGIITARSDISIADKIIHTGDTNTAIRFPAADTFTVETAGSERVRIDSSGRLILGHTDSINVDGHTSSLEVNGENYNESTVSIISNSNDTTGAYLFLSKQRSGSSGGTTIVQDGDTLGQIRFLGMDGTDYDNAAASIECNVDGTPGSNDIPGLLRFFTGDGGTLSERLRIDSSGRLLAGTTTEGEANADDLTIATSGHTGITIRSGTANRGNIYFSDGTSGDAEYRGYIEYNHDGDTLKLATANSVRATIDSSGRFGLGTSSPAQKLHIQDSSGPLLTFDDATTQFGHIGSYNKLVGSGNVDTFLVSSANSKPLVLRAPTGQTISFDIASSEALRVNSSGKMLVGSTTNNYTNTKLLIAGTAGTNYISLLNTTATDSDEARFSYLHFRGTQSGGEETSLASIGAQHDGSSDDEKGELTFRTNSGDNGNSPTERMRITSGGNIGIGCADPGTMLQVSDSGDDGTFTVGGNNAGGTGFNITYENGGTTYTILKQNYATTNNNAYTSIHTGYFTVNTGTSFTEAMRINHAGTMMIGNTVDNPGDANTNAGIAFRSNGKYFLSCAADGGHINRNNDGAIIHCRRSGNLVGSITVNSSNTSFNTSSDYRLKENVVDLSGAITRVKQLAPKRFNFIIDADKTVDGFLAHEAQTVVPEAVTGTHNEVDGDGNAVMQGIDQSKLVPLLTAALQEAIAKIETLEVQVAALQG